MAETSTPNPTNSAGDGAHAAQQPPPRLNIVTQYVKDLSFENPRAPQGITGDNRPEIQIGVEANARELGDNRYECVLELKANAKAGEETVFVIELTYGGVFNIENVPKDSLQPLLLIECPRLLFPFARRIVGDATRDGGFPPLMIDPIDFVSLYRRRLQQAQAQQAGQSAPAS